MLKQYLECGQIVNTHGIRGEVKIKPETDSPESLLRLKTLYIGGNAMSVSSARAHKGCVIAKLSGVDTVEQAQALRGSTVSFRRDDLPLEPGAFFLQDVIGLTAVDSGSGEKLGTVESVIYLPAGSVFVINGEREILVPARGEFIGERDFDKNTVMISLIEGM
ncbi:MAG: 16S rRNA processing protein RimM [Oscillospiraceae bacterium]|nr:16S rRNA processing protein RimM [Oscillospiraceae bacterium]